MLVQIYILTIILASLFIGLEIYRKIRTRKMSQNLRESKYGTIMGVRISFLVFLLIVIVLPFSALYIYNELKPTERFYSDGLGIDDEFNFKIDHIDLPAISGTGYVSYPFKIQMDIFELADEIQKDLDNNNNEYFVIDQTVYFNMNSYYMKLTKTNDSKYFKDEYVLYIDCVQIFDYQFEDDNYRLAIPYAITNELEAYEIEKVNNEYRIEFIQSKQYYLDYYNTLEEVSINGDVLTIDILGYDPSVQIVTIQITLFDTYALFEVIDIRDIP